MSEIELTTIEPVIVINENLDDNISIESISDFELVESSENIENKENSNENNRQLVNAPERVSDLLSKLTQSLPGAIANPNGTCWPPLLAPQNSNAPRIGILSIVGQGTVDIGDKVETTVDGDIVMNEIVYNENKKCAKPNISETDHPEYKITTTVASETEIKSQYRWKIVVYSIIVLIASLYLLYFILSKLKANLSNEDPDGLNIVPRIPNLKSKALRKLSLPVELIIISQTMTKNCTNRWDCTAILQSDPVQKREYNFLIGDDGTVFEGAGWTKKGKHTNAFFNKRSICFAFIGTFHYYPPSVRQIETVKIMIDKGIQLGNVIEKYKLSAACQLAFSRGLGAALNDEIKNWRNYVGPLDKSKLMRYRNRIKNSRQKRRTKRKKKTKTKPKLKLKPSCYSHL